MYYYLFHIGDYRAATAHLTNEEDLTYRRLLDWYYDTEQPIPQSDIERISRRLRITPSVAITILEDFFKLENGCWYNHRADKEIVDYKQKIEKLSKAGKASAFKRSLNKHPTDVEQRSNDVQLTNNQYPITNNQLKKSKSKLSIPDGVLQTIWEDWIALRKAKRAPVTATALKGIQKEANKAGMTLQDVLSVCCERGWVGFKAEWLKSNQINYPNKVSPQLSAARAIFGDERIIDHEF